MNNNKEDDIGILKEKITQLENKITSLTKEYEDKLSQKETEHQNEIKELNDNSESILNQLKSLFEIEKTRLEAKIAQTKQKGESDLRNLREEYEAKIKEIENDNETEIITLQNTNEDLIAKFNTISIDADHQINILTSQLATAEKTISDHEENILNITKEHNEAIQLKINQFNKERKELTCKIDQLNEEIKKNNSDKDSLLKVIEEKEEMIKTLNENIKDIKNEYEHSMNMIISKFDQYKQKQIEINNEFTIKKKDFERETSLLKQQIDFINKKMEEQAQYIEESEKIHNENITILQSSLEDNLNEKINEMLSEKNGLIEKLSVAESQIKSYEDKLSALSNYYETMIKDEKNNNKMIYSQLEKEIKKLTDEKEILNKKLNDPIKKINQLLEEQSNLQTENLHLKDKVNKLLSQQEDYDKTINSLEKEKSDLENENKQLKEQNIVIKNNMLTLSQNKSSSTNELHKRFKIFNQSIVDSKDNNNNNETAFINSFGDYKCNSARRKTDITSVTPSSTSAVPKSLYNSFRKMKK